MQMAEQNRVAATEDQRDRDLMRRYAEERSEAAFAALGRRYAGLVYSTCLRETGDRILAEDASQGVFLLLSRKANALKRYDNLAGWLYAASRYTAKNLVKQERRRQMYEAEAVAETTQQRDNGDNGSPLWEQIEPHFHDALDRLKPSDREAILLRFVQERSLSEVGDSLGLSENTARMRVNRALEKIRLHLSKAGLPITVAALAILLEEHSAQAAPVSLLQSLPNIGSGQAIFTLPEPTAALVRGITRQLARRMTARSLLLPLTPLLVFLFLAGGYTLSLPHPLNRAEQQQLFQTLAGTWNGRLEYADDRTHQHFTYPTSVVIRDINQGDTLQFTARYEGAANVDVTAFTRDARTGEFLAQNGGTQSPPPARRQGRSRPPAQRQFRLSGNQCRRQQSGTYPPHDRPRVLDHAGRVPRLRLFPLPVPQPLHAAKIGK